MSFALLAHACRLSVEETLRQFCRSTAVVDIGPVLTVLHGTLRHFSLPVGNLGHWLP
jgi:hypothetical protein